MTLSLPAIVGRHEVVNVLDPDMSEAERKALGESADKLRSATERLGC